MVRQGEIRVGHGGREAGGEPVGRRRGPPSDPREDPPPRHRAIFLTISGVLAGVSASFDASPRPADAKCCRPPPRPPLSAASALASRPALIPAWTRSSVTPTWTEALSPLAKSTEMAR